MRESSVLSASCLLSQLRRQEKDTRVPMKVCLAQSRSELGALAARDIGVALRRGLHEKPSLRMILAAAPSQSEMLAALACEPGIDWHRVTAFHMDEYVDLPEDAPQRFGAWLE